MKFISFFIVFLFSVKSFAEACPTTLLNRGSPAPCTGYMLSPEAAAEDAKLPMKITLLENKLEIKDTQIALKDQTITLYQTMHDKDGQTIAGLTNSLTEQAKAENMKVGIAVGVSAGIVAVLSICLAFAFTGAFKVSK